MKCNPLAVSPFDFIGKTEMEKVKTVMDVDLEVIKMLDTLAKQDNDPTFVADLLNNYVTQMPQTMTAMRLALAANDAVTLSETAHTLKGASGNVGAARVAELSSRVEDCARQRNLGPIRLLLDEIDEAFTQTRSDFQPYLQSA